MSDKYAHLELPNSVVEYTNDIDSKMEEQGRMDTCDVCKKEFPWKDLHWFGGTSCRICSSQSCKDKMEEGWKRHIDEMEEEEARLREEEDYW